MKNEEIVKNYLFALLFLTGLTGTLLGQGFDVEPEPAAMHLTRVYHNIVALDDGRVVVVGGHTQGFQLTSTAEIYDPETDSWELHQTPHPHDNSGFAKLPDGRYMYFGGFSGVSGTGRTNTTTIYDPADDSFTSGPTMVHARASNNAVTLSDGRILIVGSWFVAGDDGESEVYDPTTATFTPVGIPYYNRSHAPVFPMADGGALLISGYNQGASVKYYNVVEFNGADHTFTEVQESIFDDGQQWFTQWSPNFRDVNEYRMSDGRFAILTYREYDWSNREYAIGLIDPVTKTIEKLELQSEIPDYTGSMFSWATQFNPVVDSENDIMYLFSTRTSDNMFQVRLITVDLQTGEVDIPEGSHSFGYIFSLSSNVWLNNKIFATGGSVAGDNFGLTDLCQSIVPTSTVSVEELSTFIPALYPNPVRQGGTLFLDLDDNAIRQWQVFDTSGRLVMEGDMNAATGQATLNIASLTSGLYLLSFHHSRGVGSVRFVVE
ncbi:MAG: T9SS C-terminal target domain-containing protein [Cryomorphaceae bacterium]|nr:MAG: T9SS C-terminal target domain-containing protein [Cryomorphaceae bacterium]